MATGLPILFINDAEAARFAETEAYQEASGFECVDCNHPVAFGQPWCGCGCVIDWSPTGLVEVRKPAPAALREELGPETCLTGWAYPTDREAADG